LASARTPPLEWLLDSLPDWVLLGQKTAGEFRVIAQPDRAGGLRTREYHLIVRGRAEVEVLEAPDARLLPTFCPQRHINSGGLFCVGLRAGKGISDSASARQWWSQLASFLACQDTAHETRHWPQYAQLSHGEDAAEAELEAETLAAELGLREEFRRAVCLDTGIIACFARRVDVNTLRLRNGRARCVCGRRHRDGYPKLRRDCWKAKYPCLPILEYQRRREVNRFWKGFRNAAQLCCGTMVGCGLDRPPLAGRGG
jgi:hypothetical protein